MLCRERGAGTGTSVAKGEFAAATFGDFIAMTGAAGQGRS
jgi:hypothetical protein